MIMDSPRKKMRKTPCILPRDVYNDMVRYGLVAQLGERSVRIREVEGSNPFRSTKQVLDEHLFLQRRLRREMFALIHNRKAPSWE